MLRTVKTEVTRALAHRIHELWDLEEDPIVQVPPRRELGDLASPVALGLARVLRRRPRDIAEELVFDLRLPEGVREVRIEGAGYVNFFLERGRFVAAFLEQDDVFGDTTRDEKVIVEHTNINPNKAAHIGHLRNSVLGDVLVAALRRLGSRVEIQNYIDDTGVQLADVVVGFVDIRGLDLAAVAAIPEPFDFVCWDLYSEVGRWYEADEARRALRRETLHALEKDEGERAAMGRLVARRIVHRHLKTMARLGIGYDLLTRESDILHLDFFADAFEKLKASGAIRLEADGKNEGCWVMPLSEAEEFQGLEDPDKVIVRSDGTVTYVGKDIAYQLWKFGLLGRDFSYRFWDEEGLWETTSESTSPDHPDFGAADRVINVIDARQSYLQRIVKAGLQSLGHESEADRSVHFAYEMVSLSRSTAAQLGFLGDDEDEGGSLEMSGRKGIGVKADDLLDQLEARVRATIEERQADPEKRTPDLGPAEIDVLVPQIATAALRFFMVKATTTRVIAFDLDEALTFEGETGPYLQYSLVREHNIRRRLGEEDEVADFDTTALASIADDRWSDDLWDLILAAAGVPEAVERAAETLELSAIARQALELAQGFHECYNRHRILGEQDDELRAVRLSTNAVFRKGLLALCDLLGIAAPERM